MSRPTRGSLIFTPYKKGPTHRGVLAERESLDRPLAIRPSRSSVHRHSSRSSITPHKRKLPSRPSEDRDNLPPQDRDNLPSQEQATVLPPEHDNLSSQDHDLLLPQEPEDAPPEPILLEDEPIAELIPFSNTGSGPHGEAELMFEIDAASVLAITGSPSLEELPVSYFSGLRSQGFDWVFLTNFPDDVELESLKASVRRGGLRLLINGYFDEAADDDGLVVYTTDPLHTEYDYCFDPTFVEALRARNPAKCVAYLSEPGPIKFERMMHFSVTDGLKFTSRSALTASAALLLLPGLRVIRHCHWALVSQLLPVLVRPVLSKGMFSVPQVVKFHGDMVVWKYATELEHVLVCLNFMNDHAVANIICPDAPDPLEYDKIQVFEYLTETTFRRVAEEMRTTGLHVILREYEIQVLAY